MRSFNMKVYYYTGFFATALPEQMAELLRVDITERKSLAVIAGFGNWHPSEDPKVDLNFAKETWLDPAGIVFDEYYQIDRSIPKETAHEVLRNASVILLQGGYTTLQNAFLTEYGLVESVKESNAAVIIGVSAGAKNMSAKTVCVKSNKYTKEVNGIYDGLALNSFCYEPYFTLNNEELIRDALLPLSHELDIYATSHGSFLHVKNEEVSGFGDVYLILGGEIHKYNKSEGKND